MKLDELEKKLAEALHSMVYEMVHSRPIEARIHANEAARMTKMIALTVATDVFK